jgi:hypothetical protein
MWNHFRVTNILNNNRTAYLRNLYLYFKNVLLFCSCNLPPPPPTHTHNSTAGSCFPSTQRIGCAVTPCSAISQVSCQSPDDRRGAALPQEDVGGHVGVNHTQKVSRKGGNGDNSGQTPRGSGEPLRGF